MPIQPARFALSALLAVLAAPALGQHPSPAPAADPLAALSAPLPPAARESDAAMTCDDLTAEAERLKSEAQDSADRMRAEAQAAAERIGTEASETLAAAQEEAARRRREAEELLGAAREEAGGVRGGPAVSYEDQRRHDGKGRRRGEEWGRRSGEGYAP